MIVATQANHASRLVADALPEESRLLSNFRYVDVPIVVHFDESVLPRRKNDWRTFNFEARAKKSACTVWMNRFHKGWPTETNLFHSIFPHEHIDDRKIISSDTLQRPIVNATTSGLHQALHKTHLQDRRVWFVGSYASPGVPLLESAVQSSNTVVQKLISILTSASV